ncbi:MAG: hypothetical protein MZV65_28835 [Chromatiales bacterium]|nr:hypothetical protein [Chromatiales bacterium]
MARLYHQLVFVNRFLQHFLQQPPRISDEKTFDLNGNILSAARRLHHQSIYRSAKFGKTAIGTGLGAAVGAGAGTLFGGNDLQMRVGVPWRAV